MLRVVTLPITPVSDGARSFLTLITPFVADIVAKTMGATLTVMVNTVGVKSDTSGVSPHDQFLGYGRLLCDLGISSRCDHDGSRDHENHFRVAVDLLRSSSTLKTVEREMLWCGCGRVEVPIVVARQLVAQQRNKSLIIGNSLSQSRCRKCESVLFSGLEQVQTISLKESDVVVRPTLYTEEIRAVVARVSGVETVVSRRHRGTHDFDTDFRWWNYVGRVAEPGDRVIIVTSPTTLNQAVRVVLFTKMLYPDIQVELLVHSLVRLSERNELQSVTDTGFVGAVGGSLRARMLLALALRWSASETTLCQTDLNLVQITESAFKSAVRPEKVVQEKLYHRGDVVSFYKQLRKQTSVLQHEQLVRIIQPSL